MSARILITTYGSRGDVEPLLALALGLKAAGHAVRLATAGRFADWIAGHGIAFAPISDEALDQIDSEEGRLLLGGEAGLFRKLGAARRMRAKAATMMETMIADSWAAARDFEPELIVFHPKIIAAPHMAERLKIPAVMAALQPMFAATSSFPAPGFPPLRFPGFNRLSYRLVTLSYGLYRQHVNAFRTGTLGLPPIRSARAVLEPPALGALPILHAISPHVVPRPTDWPPHVRLTGYWQLPDAADFAPDPELEAFLDAGPPPVYAGFGSMPTAEPKELGQTIVAALRRAGMRGVIGSGWGGLAVENADDIHVVGSVPHDWLFPRMAAVIHHGGAGTTAAGFRAGQPSIICPFGVDQPYWARLSHKLGVGTEPLPRKALSADRLAERIRTAVTDVDLQERAKRLGEKLRAEDGVGKAVSIIEDLL